MKNRVQIPLWILVLLPGLVAGSVRAERMTPVASCGPELETAQAETWRSHKIKAIWSELHFGEPSISDQDLQALLAAEDPASVDPSAGPASYFVNGRPVLYPSPTGILVANRSGRFVPHCSVVLTQPDMVLTARHCVETLRDPVNFRIFFPWEGMRTPAINGVEFYCHEHSASCREPGADLARIRLSRPYSMIPVARPPWSGPGEEPGPICAQGFGSSNQVLADVGLLLQGAVSIAPCGCHPEGESDETLLCASVDDSSRRGGNGQLANLGGHSGGPLFEYVGHEFRLLGIASELAPGCRDDGSSEGRYVNLDAPRFRAWLSGAFTSSDYPRADGEPFRVILTVDLAYVGNTGRDTYDIEIEEGVRELIVSINHETSVGVTDLSLTLNPSLSSDCSRYSGVESCHISNPTPGAYSIGIQRESGNPAYQLTVVAIYEE